MKKIIIIILLLIIVISGYYYLDNQPYDVEDIHSIEIINTDKKITDDKIVTQYLPLINEKNIVSNKNIESSNGFDLLFNMNNGKIVRFTIFHDFENKTVDFINEESEAFTLSRAESLFFFKNKSFKTIYKSFNPDFTLSTNELVLVPSKDDFLINYTFEDDETIEYHWNNINIEKNNILTDSNELTVKTTNSSTELLVYENDVLIHNQTEFSDGLFAPDYDGTFEYVFQVKSKHQNEIKITKTVIYEIVYDRKPIFEISQDAVKQGHFIKITGKYVTPKEIQSIETLIIKDIKFFQTGHEVVAFIPIHPRTKPDTYEIKIKTENKYDHLYTVDVIDQKFKTQYLYVKPSTMASTSNAEAYAEYNKYFHPVRKISSEEQYYDENFIMPLKARITTEFGEGRYINDAATSYSHSGLDLAASKGTPVHAINHGVITLSRHFALTGNTIIIDHGQGLLSYYLHLDTLDVSLGEKVSTGDILGTVGSTGRSTGPHLHFGTSFYTTYIEPGYFIYGEPITKENYQKLFQ